MKEVIAVHWSGIKSVFSCWNKKEMLYMLDREALVESYRGQLQVVLESKVEEFQMFGYDRVTDDDIW
ncbi:hypothetical protein JG666_22760, partial [Vibrio cholerae]|nr:hypothetical protein [Vibrio cholerae]